MLLPYKSSCGLRFTCFTALVASFGLAATLAPAQTNKPAKCSPAVVSQPSLGELAREAQAARGRLNLKNVPRFTNDNLPKGEGGLSVLGPSEMAGGNAVASAVSTEGSSTSGQQIAYLRQELNQAQTHLRLHQRELAVLQQQISQSKMQWYPNPSKTLMQEYSRSNISGLSNEIDNTKRQIAQDQQAVANLSDQLQRLQARNGWVKSAAQASSAASQPALPPGVKPGTPQYWQAMIQSARRQLATAEEAQAVAKNELGLLKLQQLRSLDPNVQANLASSVSSKQGELNAAAQAVASAKEKIEALEKEAQKGSADLRR
ncbi:MAG: hypothetical protein KGM47_06325 [Acidobacteriota bacterium]|nr:hypothetical protein [Acidobacteriota bacterium]